MKLTKYGICSAIFEEIKSVEDELNFYKQTLESHDDPDVNYRCSDGRESLTETIAYWDGTLKGLKKSSEIVHNYDPKNYK